MMKAIRFLFLLLLAGGALQAQKIEFYADWAWNCKGTKLFAPTDKRPLEDWPVLWQLPGLLKEKGWEIESWDWDYYQPILSRKDTVAWNAWALNQKNLSEGLWIFWNMAGNLQNFDLSRMPKEKLVLFMWEPPSVQLSLYDPKVQALFGKIFTWDDDLVDNVKFFKFNYPSLKKRIANIPPFEEKKFCVMINSHLKSSYSKELYSERERVAKFFEQKEGEFDLFGHSWAKNEYKNWKGKAGNKYETLKKYRFCICYENTRDIKGYITEKLFDCFSAGCVPVYWGASNVTDFVDEGCFVDRRQFKDTQELYDYLKGMDRKEYEGYLERAARYIESEKAQQFTAKAFLNIFMKVLFP